MKELFEKEGQSIFCFKPGDVIIRLKPVYKVVHNENLGISMRTEEVQFRGYEEPMTLLAIENNQIYLRYASNQSCLKGMLSVASIDQYSEDWGLFVLPKGITIEDL